MRLVVAYGMSRRPCRGGCGSLHLHAQGFCKQCYYRLYDQKVGRAGIAEQRGKKIPTEVLDEYETRVRKFENPCKVAKSLGYSQTGLARASKARRQKGRNNA